MQHLKLSDKAVRRGLMFVLAVMIVAAAVAVYLATRPAPRDDLYVQMGRRGIYLSDLQEAETRWDSYPVAHAHYHLTVKYSGAMWAGPNYAECVQDVEVTDEIVTSIYQDTCQSRSSGVQVYFASPVTVTGLFSKFKRDLTTQISADDMWCYGIVMVQATYDPFLGYPISAVYKREGMSPENLGPETYATQYASLTHSPCLLNGPPVPPRMAIDFSAMP